MPQTKPFNLFVYGTLMNAEVFRAVTGLRMVKREAECDNVTCFRARRAILPGYHKISPDHTYLYAVPEQHGRIRGYIIGPLPARTMSALLQYEGRNYSRRTVMVQTRLGPERAKVFVGNVKQLQHAFGYDFHDHYKQEILLEEKIEAALVETEQQQLHRGEGLLRRALAELHGSTIRDLRRRHFEAGGISDYAIRHSLMDAPLPDFRRVADDPEAKALAPNYLAMVIRQVVFNQYEDRIRKDFRYEIEHMKPGPEYYDRTISSLAALRLVNGSGPALDMMTADAMSDLSFQADHLVDYVRWSILAADELYDSRLARIEIEFIRNHSGRGYIPMGAELEFSNIGHAVINDPQGQAMRDMSYDGFLYFPDFGLNVLTWKLGGHIDDHHDKASESPRRGFFEVAMGNLSIRANISKPLTDDPWLLNQLIHQARMFYKIAPHSVHISLQMRRQQSPVQDRPLPPAMLKCLFAIAGDPVRTPDGHVRISRLQGDEILAGQPDPHLLFSEISLRHSSESDEFHPAVRTGRAAGTYVQQFKFLRLASDLNYEPIAMALKGIQISLRPGSILTTAQYRRSSRSRALYHELTEWGKSPQPLGDAEIDSFLSAVDEGLDTERFGKPVHSGAYIAWAIQQLRSMLRGFNMLINWKKPEKPAGGSTAVEHEPPAHRKP
jgi:hypothetical protein